MRHIAFQKRISKNVGMRSLLMLFAAVSLSFSSVAPVFAGSPPTIVNETFTTNSGTMSVVSGGSWSVSGGAYNLTTPATAEYGNGNVSISSVPINSSNDFNIEVDGKLAASSELSIIFDYSDPQNYSYAHFSSTASDFSQGIFKVAGGNVSQVAAYDSALPINTFQTVKVKYSAGKIKAYKGTTYLTGLDLAVRQGSLTGIGTTRSAAVFDKYTVAGTAASSTIAPLPQVVPQPPVTPPAQPTTCTNFQATRTVNAATSTELSAALANAQPGDDIVLTNGTYAGNFDITTSGTAQNPIRLRGVSSSTTILDAGSTDGSPVLHLTGANNWCVTNLKVTNGNKGIMSDSSSGNVFQYLDVSTVGDEAVHFRSCSSNNIIQNSSIHDTGLRRDSFGEGVYLGTADSNWGVYNFCDLGNPDQSNFNTVRNNTFARTTAEAIDVKEGTKGGRIENNTFDGTGMIGNHADSLIDVKGANYSITGNTVTVSGTSTVVDGFQTHVIAVRTDVTQSGTGNVFSGNSMSFAGISGYGINIGNGSTALVTCDNVVTGAALGMSNLACRP